MAEKLKSAVELAMERFAAKDKDSQQLTDRQKEQIAEIRNKTAAKLAELEILYKADLAKLEGMPPGTDLERRVQLRENYVQERGRQERDRDSKIERIRSAST